MGLESVEFIMTVEDCFGLRIPDEEATQMRTVGDMCAFLLQEMRQRPAAACNSARVFYRFRNAMVSKVGVERASVRPDSRLADLFPGGIQWHTWQYVQKDLDFELPPLWSRSWWREKSPHIPQGCETVRGLVSHVAERLPQPIAPEPGVVWDVLCEIISLELGVAKESIRPETRFVEDLGF